MNRDHNINQYISFNAANLLMTKASGTLEININVDREKAKEIKTMIDNAGVSSFYLGKKGLAYITDIDTREARN